MDEIRAAKVEKLFTTFCAVVNEECERELYATQSVAWLEMHHNYIVDALQAIKTVDAIERLEPMVKRYLGMIDKLSAEMLSRSL